MNVGLNKSYNMIVCFKNCMKNASVYIIRDLLIVLKRYTSWLWRCDVCSPHYSSPWIWKGVSATLQSGRYALSYPRCDILLCAARRVRTLDLRSGCRGHRIYNNARSFTTSTPPQPFFNNGSWFAYRSVIIVNNAHPPCKDRAHIYLAEVQRHPDVGRCPVIDIALSLDVMWCLWEENTLMLVLRAPGIIWLRAQMARALHYYVIEPVVKIKTDSPEPGHSPESRGTGASLTDAFSYLIICDNSEGGGGGVQCN